MTGLQALLEHDPPPEEAASFLGAYNLPYNRTIIKNLKSIAENLTPHIESAAFLMNLLDQVKETAHPEQALNHAERFFNQLETPKDILQTLEKGPHTLRILTILFGASPYLSGILIQNPGLLLWLVQDRIWQRPINREALIQEVLEHCQEITDLKEAYPILRHLKQREILRIGAKDLTGFSDFTETAENLSILAEVCLEAAYQVVNRFLMLRHGTPRREDETGNLRECRFAILAMGKLGGSELNFSSDIDLLYLYELDGGETTGVSNASGGTQGKMDNHLYFVRLSEGISDLVNANTEDGFVFRVDLRLRPEGSHGPVASSLRSYELYYESFGQTWERAALIKCRPVAGDLSLGNELIHILRPFVYRKYLDYTAIDEIREMKRKILQELGQKPSRGVNIKLDRGGIREIEFFIQALQLIYGGKIRWIREWNSLRALHRLCDKKLITYEDFSTLSSAYTFLRDVEHKLQVEHQLQLQTLPIEPEKIEQLARRCGALDGETFLQELDRHRQRVQELFENLLYEKEEEGSRTDSPVHAILFGGAEVEEVYDHLSRLGFQDPRQTYKNIQLLKDGPPYAHTSTRCRILFMKIAPALLREVASSPDPDMALNHLERFTSVYGAREIFYGLLKENITAMQRIVALFSISDYFSNLLVRHPDSIEVLFGKDLTDPAPQKDEIYHHLMEGLRKTATGAPRIDFLRRFKHVEELKIGLWDILKETELLETSRSLSRLADACLETAYTLATEDLSEIYGSPQEAGGKQAGFAIMGGGKLGSEEMTYGSDLDLLFVFSRDGESTGPEKISNRDYFTRLAERIVTLLSSMTAEGVVFRVDLRLRPLGEGGPLVQSLKGFQEYFERRLQTWERQALTRVRCCAGNRQTGNRLYALIQETLYGSPPPPDLNQKILEMRSRIEKEKARPAEGLLFFKAGAGGLIDIEFMVQYLQLRYGRETPEIRSVSILQVLEEALRHGFLSEEDAFSLKESYLFLHRLESRVRIVQDRPITSLTSDPRKNHALALRMGYTDDSKTLPGHRLLDDYQSVTQKTREIFHRLLDDRKQGK